MNTWFRKVGMGAVALTLAGVLGGCNNGGGGGLIRLFFGINGQGSCTSVIVDVNLDDADAVIARDNDGEVQCDLNEDLQDAGCEIDFVEFSNGDLRAIIDDCTIPAVTNLFSCLFEDVDISELQETASAQCSCTTENCDGTPPVCISLDPDPDSCEDCDNGIDDDGNGLEDCEDPNCENFPGCQGTTTTSTSSTSTTISTTTSTTSTTSTSTTSTTMVEQFDCTLVFRLADDVTLGSLQYDTDYSNAPGEMLGQGGNVECASLVEGSLAAFNDVDAEENLDSGIISLDGFTGPVNVAECTFRANIVPTAGDFTITVTEASTPDLDPIVPLPDVVITSINCDVTTTTTIPTTTTTVDTTTTTLDVVTTTTMGGGGEGDYKVTFRLDTASAGVGALQWSTNYGSAPGGFQGSGASVACTNKVGGALFAPNDEEGSTKLTLGIIALTEFNAPLDLVDCTFNATSTPDPSDFPIVIEDATDGGGSPIDAAISVTVTPIP